MDLDPRFLDHFRSPRNVGDLPDAPIRVEVENPVCGDQLLLCVSVKEGKVDQVAISVRGCSGAVAACSVMSELVRGQPLGTARRLDRDAIDQALGGLPALKRHGADLAADGLRQALAQASALEGRGGAE